MSGGKMVAMGATAAALGAGAYYLFGPNNKKHQQKARALMVKMKREISMGIRKAKVVGTPVYYKAVDAISANYAKQYKMHAGEIKAFAEKLKSEWKGVNKIVKKTKRVTKKKRK